MDNTTQSAEPNEPAVVKSLGDHHPELSGFISPADARLIAAAPDMLAALQLLLDGCGRVSLDAAENLMVWSGSTEELRQAKDTARAAIAKATGAA